MILSFNQSVYFSIDNMLQGDQVSGKMEILEISGKLKKVGVSKKPKSWLRGLKMSSPYFLLEKP